MTHLETRELQRWKLSPGAIFLSNGLTHLTAVCLSTCPGIALHRDIFANLVPNAMGPVLIGREALPCRHTNSGFQSCLRWQSSCRTLSLRRAKVQHRQQSLHADGAMCMAAAVEAPTSHKDNREFDQQAPASEPIRREEVILFQGDRFNSNLLLFIRSNATAPAPSNSDDRSTLRIGYLCSGFGWDSCQVGGWWKIVQSKIQEMKVCITACSLIFDIFNFCSQSWLCADATCCYTTVLKLGQNATAGSWGHPHMAAATKSVCRSSGVPARAAVQS